MYYCQTVLLLACLFRRGTMKVASGGCTCPQLLPPHLLRYHLALLGPRVTVRSFSVHSRNLVSECAVSCSPQPAALRCVPPESRAPLAV